MALIELVVSDFRAAFPAFASEVLYPDEVLEGKYISVTCIISNYDENQCLSTKQRTRALYLMLAHLLRLDSLIAQGQNTVFVSSATIDKVSVSVMQPPVSEGDTFVLWLHTTNHGQEYLAIMSVATSGGAYIGGAPERAAFRRVGGIQR